VGGMTQQDGVTGRVDLAAMLSGEHYGETKWMSFVSRQSMMQNSLGIHY
jgi:hypothetical protein